MILALALAVLLLLAGATWVDIRGVRATMHPVPLPVTTVEGRPFVLAEIPMSSVCIREVVPCGSAQVTVTTCVGVGYDGSPIPGETFAQAKARHEAKVAEVIRECGG